MSYGFDIVSKKFWLVFNSDSQIQTPTGIYLPENHYPDGWKLNINKGQQQYETRWLKEIPVPG